MGTVFSIGNKADLNEADFLQALAEDKKTSVVAAYLESITDGNKFLRIAEEAANIKPIVILKVGITSAGAKAASSHTGSLAGADIAYGAAFKRPASFGPKILNRCLTTRSPSPRSRSRRAIASASSPTPAGRASWPRTPPRRAG